jgi:hypothetical protein
VFLLSPPFWFFVPLVAALFSLGLLLLIRTRDGAALTTAACFLASFVGLVATALWGWLRRDGLYPGVVPSEGSVAWFRFAEGYCVPLVAFAAVLGACVWVRRRRLPSLEDEDNVPEQEPGPGMPAAAEAHEAD